MNKCDDCKHFKGSKPWKPCNQKGWKVLKNEGVKDCQNYEKVELNDRI